MTSNHGRGPRSSAKVSAKSAAAEVITPGISIRRGPLVSRDSRMTTAASARVANPTGTLMKKIQPQLRYWLSRPPISGPTASARAPTALQIPTAAARCRPSVNVAEMIASVVGRDQCGAKSLYCPTDHQDVHIAGETRRQRRSGEDRQPDHEQPFPPQTSASRPPASNRLANTRM